MSLKKKPIRPNLADDHSSTQELIAAIENKDRRFRFAQTIFMVGTFLALIVVIGAQQKTLNAVQAQLAQAKSTAAAQSKQADEAATRIERRLDCMVVFFSQKDRTALSIADIDKCTLNRDGSIQQFFQQDDKSTSSVQTNQPTSATTQSSTPAANPSPTGTATPVTPAPVATGTPDPPASLNFSICVPFTKVCL